MAFVRRFVIGCRAHEFPSEVAEMALAHAIGDKVEAAYCRGDLFQRPPAHDDGLGDVLPHAKADTSRQCRRTHAARITSRVAHVESAPNLATWARRLHSNIMSDGTFWCKSRPARYPDRRLPTQVRDRLFAVLPQKKTRRCYRPDECRAWPACPEYWRNRCGFSARNW
jgi:hypothetical protein